MISAAADDAARPSPFQSARGFRARGLDGRRLGAKDASAAILVRSRPFVGEQGLDRRSGSVPLQLPCLFVQAPDRRQLFGLAEFGFLHGGFQHVDGTVIDLQRHRIGMPVLAAMSDREPRRIAEAIGRAMNDLRDLGQRTDGPCTDAGNEQKLGEILRTACGGSCQVAVQASGDDVPGPDIVMTGHDKMRQHGLCLQSRMFDPAPLQPGKLPLDPIGSELCENGDLALAGGLRTPIGQVDDHALFDAIDRGMRLVDEALQAFGQPVISAGPGGDRRSCPAGPRPSVRRR